MKGIVVGPLIVTTVTQGLGAPVFDRAMTSTPQGQRFKSIAIHLTPWRKNQYGDREIGRALVLGLRQ